MKTTAVIMAGGRGERIWPQSRQSCPKQFLSLTDDGKTMLQHTTERLRSLVSFEDMFIAANRDYVDLIKNQLPQIPENNILLEPMAKSTAPCIGFAAAVISKKYTDAVMLVLPSDHLIENNERYIDTMKRAVEVAKVDSNLVTIGISPTYPETGYGYICFEPVEADAGKYGAYKVRRFVEKPDLDTAKAYIASGQYLWNSGMFTWKSSAILKRFQALLPDIYKGLLMIRDTWGTSSFESMLEKCYAEFKSESIDYGIMERASDIFTVPGDFGWDDAGSFLVLERINKTDECGNTVRGDVIIVGTENSIIVGGKKLIAAVGLTDLIIVDTDDVLLICDKPHIRDVKKVIENLKADNRSELL